MHSVACQECGAAFESIHYQARYCSPLCYNRANIRRTNERRRRAGSTNRTFPRVRYRERRAVFERDGWRCGLCRAVIDPQLQWPHPGSGSIDHIDPRGAHEPANWQASHLLCNVQAGAKRIAA